MIRDAASEIAMKDLGRHIGELLRGGEMIELVGDVGAGKTTFTKGLAAGLGIDEDVQSPSFTISRLYDARDGLQLAHYDFYRLDDAGIMTHELDEAINDPSIVTVVEWADAAKSVLPQDRLQIHITSPSINDRKVVFSASGSHYEKLLEKIA
jgi:tRNA threonylcarbamoyladenosine biosynthesis protein TsaE